ncbi:unnamed protein product [Porites lobata]|uniref:Uncharacterized protein n=1 Tax=Porites lobata TaxID=104759 RepID=A0ABN8MP85_9CNID|nr:unnamed protein product [Porites lobata]
MYEYSNTRHPNIKFTMEAEIIMDIMVSCRFWIGGNLCPCITSVFRKKTYTGLLTNYFSFTPFQYKLGLIKTLINGAYKINKIT